MLTGPVTTVVCNFAPGGAPRVTVKYDLADADNPALGVISGVERQVADPALLAQIAALAGSLVPATSDLLGIPLTLPAGM